MTNTITYPDPPYPVGSDGNALREGWRAFFAGREREVCPFPPGRDDLQRNYRRGWDAAKNEAINKGWYCEVWGLVGNGEHLPVCPTQPENKEAVRQLLSERAEKNNNTLPQGTSVVLADENTVEVKHHINTGMWFAGKRVYVRPSIVAGPRLQLEEVLAYLRETQG